MIDRELNLEMTLGAKSSAFLFGPRGVGKTFLAKQFLKACKDTVSFDFLNLDTYRRYLSTPSLFRREIEQRIQSAKPVLTVLIDEVQKYPAILDEIHALIETHKGKVRFLLTGSSARKLKRGGANMLAGRAWTLKLHPFTSREVNVDIHRALTVGTLPMAHTGSEPQGIRRYLKAYVDTYIREEILQELLVRNTDRFLRLVEFAAQVNGEPVNFTKIAGACGMSIKTAQEHFNILVDTLVATRIDGWSTSVRKQLRQGPKFYFFDCGVLNSINGELMTELKPSSYRFGKLFEMFVVNEIIRANDYFESGFRFYYWRTNTGVEVDLILSRGMGTRPIAIEIKSETSPQTKDLNALQSYHSENKTAELFCLCQTPNPYRLDNIQVLPWKSGIEMILKS